MEKKPYKINNQDLQKLEKRSFRNEDLYVPLPQKDDNAGVTVVFDYIRSFFWLALLLTMLGGIGAVVYIGLTSEIDKQSIK